MRGKSEKEKKKAGKKKNKRKSLVHALITQKCQSTPIKCNQLSLYNMIENNAKIKNPV